MARMELELVGEARGWRLYRADDPEDEEPQVVAYCPACAEREFGDVSRLVAD